MVNTRGRHGSKSNDVGVGSRQDDDGDREVQRKKSRVGAKRYEDEDGWINVDKVREQKRSRAGQARSGRDKVPPAPAPANKKIEAGNTLKKTSSEVLTNGSSSSSKSKGQGAGPTSPARSLPNKQVLLPPSQSPAVVAKAKNKNTNWTIIRLLSEEIYSVMEKHEVTFGGEYLSLQMLAEVFHDKISEEAFSAAIPFLGVQVTTIYDLFRYGETGVQLRLEGKSYPHARRGEEDVTLTAMHSLAELLRRILEPGDILFVFAVTDKHIGSVFHLNIGSSGSVKIVHYRHNGVFNPNLGDGLEDPYHRIQDPRIQVKFVEMSATENSIELKPQTQTAAAADLVVSQEVRAESHSPGPSQSQHNSNQEVVIQIPPFALPSTSSQSPREPSPPPAEPELSHDMFEQSPSTGPSSGKSTACQLEPEDLNLTREECQQPSPLESNQENQEEEVDVVGNEPESQEVLLVENNNSDNSKLNDIESSQGSSNCSEESESTKSSKPLPEIEPDQQLRTPSEDHLPPSEAIAADSQNPDLSSESADDEIFEDAADNNAEILQREKSPESMSSYFQNSIEMDLARESEEVIIPPGDEEIIRSLELEGEAQNPSGLSQKQAEQPNTSNEAPTTTSMDQVETTAPLFTDAISTQHFDGSGVFLEPRAPGVDPPVVMSASPSSTGSSPVKKKWKPNNKKKKKKRRVGLLNRRK